MRTSKIEWTEATWNPVTGCTPISLGCQNCYARTMASRLQAMGQPNYKNGFEVTCHPHAVDLPLRWRKPQLIFVNSMSDLFHEDVPFEFIERVFSVMNRATWHRFQILTKRSNRLLELSERLTWTDNIWMGVTVECGDFIDRTSDLVASGAQSRFLSCEPLLGPLPELSLTGIDWVIVGGESGPKARMISEDWVTGLRDQCIDAAVPFFFKQWGGVNKKKTGRVLQGKTWDERPRGLLNPSATLITSPPYGP